MEVVVSERGLTLNSLQGIAPTVLQNAIGATMSLNDLIKTMRNAACDIFPDDDGFCYTENSCEKNHVMENHIYESISCFALSHNFAWSRWNVGSGSRTSVFLMRELIEHRKLVNKNQYRIFCAFLFFKINLYCKFLLFSHYSAAQSIDCSCDPIQSEYH